MCTGMADELHRDVSEYSRELRWTGPRYSTQAARRTGRHYPSFGLLLWSVSIKSADSVFDH